MATKTIPWDTSDPSKGDITLEANVFSGTQDVNVSTVENIGKKRSKRIVFYSTRNNMRSAQLTVVQNPATCSLEWNATGASTIVVGYAADSYNLFIKSNISSNDYISVTAKDLPDGWSVSDVESVSDGVYKVVLTTTKAGTANLSGSIEVTVGELDPVVANFTQNARYVVSSVYGNYTVTNNSIKIAPKTGFTANQELSAAGGTWGLFRGTSDVPYRVRTDTYNTGEVEYVNVDITDDVVLIVSAYNEAENGRTLTVLKNLTWGELKGAIQGLTTGTDAVLRASTLGTTYVKTTGYIVVSLSCANSEGGSYTLYTTGTKYEAADGKETFRVPQQPNIPVSYNFNATNSYGDGYTYQGWFKNSYDGSIAENRSPEIGVPVLGGKSAGKAKIIVATTFTSGSIGLINPYKIGFRFQWNNGPVSIPYYASNSPTEEEQFTSKFFEFYLQNEATQIYGKPSLIVGENTNPPMFRVYPVIKMKDSDAPDYDEYDPNIVNPCSFVPTLYNNVYVTIVTPESNGKPNHVPTKNEPYISLLNAYIKKYTSYLTSDNRDSVGYTGASFYSPYKGYLTPLTSEQASFAGQTLGDIVASTYAKVKVNVCIGALFETHNIGPNDKLSGVLYIDGRIISGTEWEIRNPYSDGRNLGIPLFPGNSATGEFDVNILDKLDLAFQRNQNVIVSLFLEKH